MDRAQPTAASPGAIPSRRQRIRTHLGDPLYRTGYYLILGTGTTAVIGIAFWALAAQMYSARSVGLNSAAVSALALVSGASTLGLGPVLVRYLPIAGGSTRTLVVRTYAATVTLSLVLGAAAALTSPLWSPSLDFLAHGGWLVGFVLATSAMTIFMLQDNVLTGLKSAKWIPLENSLYSLAKLVLLVALVGVLPGSGLFVAWSAPLPLAVLLISLLVFRRLIPAGTFRGSLVSGQILRMATGNYAGLLFNLAATLYLPILVTNLRGADETAYFYVPWSIFIGLQLVSAGMMASLTVEAAGDMAQLRPLTRRALRQTLLLVCPLAAVIAIAAPWLLLVSGSAYADAGAPLLRIFAVSQIASLLVLLGISVARIQHRARTLLAVQAAEAILVLGLSAILVPRMGIEGVGVAWLLSHTLLAVILLGGILRPLLIPQRWAGAASQSPNRL